MPVESQDRPVDVLRKEVIDQLIVIYAHEEPSREAFGRRLELLDDATPPGKFAKTSSLIFDEQLHRTTSGRESHTESL